MLKKYYTIFFIIFAVILLLFNGCSDNKTKSTLPDTHPKSWTDPASSDFHGTAVTADPNRLASCAECHGEDSGGGKVNVSCIDCHFSTGACTSCHGGLDNNSGAPPSGLRGEIDDTTLAVGAHTIHLEGSDIAAAYPCQTCHIVPALSTDVSHLDLNRAGPILDSIAEITWGGIVDSSSAIWDRASGQCQNLYCHGNFLGGYASNAPVWKGENQAECGSCHDVGTNPIDLKFHHDFHIETVGLICNDCHASVVDSTLNILNTTLHVNGVVDTSIVDRTVCNNCHDVGTGSCVTCHGGLDNQTGAPPYGLRDEVAADLLAVGAHTSHVDNGTLADAFDCDACHTPVLAVADTNHLEADSIAEITWGNISGNNSNWDRNNATCSDTYCHGNFTGGNNFNTPVWTAANQAECGSCHDNGTNPALLLWKHNFHVNSAGLDCSACHSTVVDDLLAIIDLNLHVNGIVDTVVADTTVCDACHGNVVGSCISCHGGVDNLTGAPPQGVEGELLTTELAVGAHTTHVEGGQFAEAVECSSCHVVPIDPDAPNHRDLDPIPEIIWGGISGASSSWDRNNATCSDTYCHGNFTGGNSLNAPIWTGDSQADCGSCHDVGSNPANLLGVHEEHVSYFGLLCTDCHSTVIDSTLAIINKGLHINGTVESQTLSQQRCDVCHSSDPQYCTSCHGGTDNQTGAPPVGIEGETSTTALAVGAHTTHLEGKDKTYGFACSSCHVVPTSFVDAGHYDTDSTAEITWSAFAGLSPSWDRASATCADTYCHGDFRGGYASNIPIWTGSNQSVCGSCHNVGSNPIDLRDRHDKHVNDKGLGCFECHSTTVDNELNIIGKDFHVNGTNNVSYANAPDGTYSDGSCSNVGVDGCHDNDNPKTW